MANSLLIQFERHPAELAAVGKIVLAYGELEFAFMDTLRAVLNEDLGRAARTIYRLKSESNRLEIADALLAPALADYPFGGMWNEAYCALKFCKNIRNQYAHAQWVNDDGQLRFGDLDEAAQSKGDKFKIRLRPISLAALTKQLAYFEYAHHLVMWIGDQVRLAEGQPRMVAAKVPKPKKAVQPKTDSLGEAQPPRLSERGSQPPPALRR